MNGARDSECYGFFLLYLHSSHPPLSSSPLILTFFLVKECVPANLTRYLAILDFKMAAILNQCFANILASKRLRRPILVSKCVLWVKECV